MAVRVKLLDMVSSLSRAMDLVTPVVVNHHTRVGFVAARLAETLGLEPRLRQDLLLAGLLHDAGALSLKSRLDALDFDARDSDHAEAGYRLLRRPERLRRVADLVRHHHVPFPAMKNKGLEPVESNILNLADRMDVLVHRTQPVPPQAERIIKRLARVGGKAFASEYLDAFMDLASHGEFWGRAEEPGIHLRAAAPPELAGETLDVDGVLEFSTVFSQIIDFRSRFTSTHSRGVAETAVELARRLDFLEDECKLMRVAGNLHDVGKLAVPREILEKPGPLDAEEFALIKKHALYGDSILGAVPGLEQVRQWAAHHHERIDGRGYPFQRREEDLPLGSRILAVADVFTAITEDRPYRAGMDRGRAMGVMTDMVATHALDEAVVRMLFRHFDAINSIREAAQAEARAEFATFYTATEAA